MMQIINPCFSWIFDYTLHITDPHYWEYESTVHVYYMSIKCYHTVTVITLVLLSVQSVIIVSLVNKYTNSKLLLNYCSAEMKLSRNYNNYCSVWWLLHVNIHIHIHVCTYIYCTFMIMSSEYMCIDLINLFLVH